jgi:hypothetical protein
MDRLLPPIQAVAPEASISIDKVVAYAGLDVAVDHPAVVFMKCLLGRNDHSKERDPDTLPSHSGEAIGKGLNFPEQIAQHPDRSLQFGNAFGASTIEIL